MEVDAPDEAPGVPTAELLLARVAPEAVLTQAIEAVEPDLIRESAC